MYMVTDNLVVTPMSYIYAVSYLNSLKVPFSDLEERVITIGVKEVRNCAREEKLEMEPLLKEVEGG